MTIGIACLYELFIVKMGMVYCLTSIWIILIWFDDIALVRWGKDEKGRHHSFLRLGSLLWWRGLESEVLRQMIMHGWWFGTFFIFAYMGNNHPNWVSYFSEGWPNHQPVIVHSFFWTNLLGHSILQHRFWNPWPLDRPPPPPQGWGALHTKLCAAAMERFQVPGRWELDGTGRSRFHA